MTEKWWLEQHPNLMEHEMSEPKRYFTAVFELTPAFSEGNPMTTDTPWGRAICISIGDVTHQAEIYEDALADIADDGCLRCAEAAQKAIDAGAAYVHSQIGRVSLKAEEVAG